MKKILLIIILLGFFSVSSIAQVSSKIYPVQSFVGITKKNDSYTSQSISNEAQQFFVGYDVAKQTYGRGYLEFDISYIPKKAIIKSVTLQLTSKIAWDSNFNGKIRLYSCGKYKDANSVIWTSLKGFTGLDIMSVDLNREGDGKPFSSSALTQIVSKNAGGSIYLSMNHVDESKIIRFSGDTRDLYLEVVYEEQSSVKPPSNGNGSEEETNPLYSCPQNTISGESFKLGYRDSYLPPATKIKDIIYDESLFKEVIKSSGSVTFATKEIIGEKEGEITIVYDQNSFGWITRTRHTWSFPIYGKPYIQNKENIICSGNTIYEIVSPFIPNTTTSIQWGTAENMKFISAGNPFLATYSSIAPGKTKVKATVTINGKDDNKDFHRDYPIENSDVWVGPPMAASGIGFIPNDPIIEIPQETPEYLCINKAFSNKNYIYSQITGGDLISNTEYQWIKKTNNFNLASTTFSKAMVVPTTKGDMIIEYTTKNKCGSMAGPIKYIIKATECDLNGNPINSGGGGGVITPPDDFIPMSRSSVEPQPTSIRIYSYPTGSLVYQKKNTISFDIQSTNLGEGIYILEMTDQQGNVTREKVMKGKQ